jgi:radical SAM-linked protein
MAEQNHSQQNEITMRFKFRREASLRFLSHLDQQSAFQRAFRRAGIPLAYSRGFHAHPRMAFAQAMPVGMTSDGEYGDVALTQTMDPDIFIQAFNQSMPAGLRITEAWAMNGKVPSLTAAVKGAEYCITVPGAFSVSAVEEAVEAFLRQTEINIQKRNKKGKYIEKNIRPFIEKLTADVGEDALIFGLQIKFIDQATVKPLQVIGRLNQFAALGLGDALDWRLHRCALNLNWTPEMARNEYIEKM